MAADESTTWACVHALFERWGGDVIGKGIGDYATRRDEQEDTTLEIHIEVPWMLVLCLLMVLLGMVADAEKRVCELWPRFY